MKTLLPINTNAAMDEIRSNYLAVGGEVSF